VAEEQKRSAGIEHGVVLLAHAAGSCKGSRLCLWTIKVASGWRDFGLKIRGLPARELAAGSDEMFAGANLRHNRFPAYAKRLGKGPSHSPGARFFSPARAGTIRSNWP